MGKVISSYMPDATLIDTARMNVDDLRRRTGHSGFKNSARILIMQLCRSMETIRNLLRKTDGRWR